MRVFVGVMFSMFRMFGMFRMFRDVVISPSYCRHAAGGVVY